MHGDARQSFIMKCNRIGVNCIILCISAVLLGLVYHYGSYRKESIPVINEVCTVNFSVIADADGNYLDYLELYNPEDEAYTMDGLWLSDDRDEPQRYSMSGITVPAQGYALIWMVDEQDATDIPDITREQSTDSDSDEDAALDCPQYYCPFNLSKKGGYLYISNDDSKILESVTVPSLTYNVAYGRATDGDTRLVGMEPTPGASNDAAEEISLHKADAPVLSAESGFYDDAFELTIGHAFYTDVYYTLDGTTPTTESIQYDGPITIDDPSENPNVYSANDDIYLHNYVPEEPVDKAVVVRAIAVDRRSGAVSDVVSRTYFVGYAGKSDYNNIAVVSLITDPDNLFDYNTGIYVMGATYDEYKEKGGFLNLTSSQVPGSFSDESGHHDRYMYTNSEHRGREWERPVTVEYYDADHNLQLAQTAGLRIAGESTRYLPHKSMNLLARSIYGSRDWSFSFWGYNDVDTLRLRASGGESIRWKESFVQSLNGGRMNGIQHSIPCAVFMDGEYWGLYQLTEQYTPEYFRNYYGVAEENLTIYKNHVITQGDAEQGMSDYEDLEEIITTYDMSADHLYQLAADRVNMDSLIDFFCANTYLSNVDIVAHHNQEMWRGVAEGADNRWNYVIYDMDQTCDDPAYNTIADYKDLETFYWPMYLCNNAAFKQQYVTTMMDLANVEYSYRRVHSRLEAKAALLEEQSIATMHRYEDTAYDAEDYETEVARLDEFFRLRGDYIERFLAEDLGLSDIATVTVTNSDINAGAVKINSSVLTAEDYTCEDDSTEGAWSGDYFTDYSITLTAIAIDGYTFAGWSGDIESPDPTISIPITTEGINIRAEFVKAE